MARNKQNNQKGFYDGEKYIQWKDLYDEIESKIKQFFDRNPTYIINSFWQSSKKTSSSQTKNS